MSSEERKDFRAGMRDGIPIALGYLAVSFALGIAARNAGLNPVQSFLASLFCLASAGEYAGFTLIAAGAGALEIATMTLIVNARYFLMGCALSQHLPGGCAGGHRPLLAYGITDEIFAISIVREPYTPWYTYGAIVVSAPCWAIGTALGCQAGNIMPARLGSALSVALFGMFLAVIVPQARKDRVIAGLIVLSFAASFAASYLPALAEISAGTRTIALTVILSAGAALLFPRRPDREQNREEA